MPTSETPIPAAMSNSIPLRPGDLDRQDLNFFHRQMAKLVRLRAEGHLLHCDHSEPDKGMRKREFCEGNFLQVADRLYTTCTEVIGFIDLYTRGRKDAFYMSLVHDGGSDELELMIGRHEHDEHRDEVACGLESATYAEYVGIWLMARGSIFHREVTVEPFAACICMMRPLKFNYISAEEVATVALKHETHGLHVDAETFAQLLPSMPN